MEVHHMGNKVILPKIGLTMTKATIFSWNFSVGDEVKTGDELFTFETDKAESTVLSDFSGTITEILANEGDEVAVFDTVCIIGGDDVPEQTVEKPQSVEEPMIEKVTLATPTAKIEPIEKTDRIFITPLAKKIAKEHGISVGDIPHSGMRIKKADVLSVLEQQTDKATPPCDEADGVELAGLRRAIAQKMSRSKSEIPHVYFKTDIDFSRLCTIKNSMKERLNQQVSYTALMLRVITKALDKHPSFNAQFVDDRLYLRDKIDISVAINLPDGLVAPCIFDLKNRNSGWISEKLQELSADAKSGRLTPKQLSEGGFTLTNLGAKGVSEFTAIINHPQVAILSMGAIEKRAVVIKDNIEIRPMVTVVLSVDHRVIDGSAAADFLADIKLFCESPGIML